MNTNRNQWRAQIEDQRDDLAGLYEGDTLLYKYIPMPLAQQMVEDHNRAIVLEAALREIVALPLGSEPALDLQAVKRVAERGLREV